MECCGQGEVEIQLERSAVSTRMAGRGWGLEISATSTAPRLGVLRASLYSATGKSVMKSQIHQETSFDYVPIQSAPPSWRMSYYWLLCGMSPGQYRLRVSVRCDEVCDVQEQRTLIGGQ